MDRQCTYVGCVKSGVGRSAETASNWLCDDHLAEFRRRTEAAQAGEDNATQRLLGFIVRAGGGAAAMTERMKPSVEAGARAVEALRSVVGGGE